MTKRLFVIGHPLTHTVSPAFQQAALDHIGIPAVYAALPTPPERLEEVVARMREDDCLGFNITIPHKQRMLCLVDEIDAMAKSLGAINTVINRGGSLVGHNTDAYGFVRSLKDRAGFDPQGKDVTLLGAGGAARAAAFALGEARVRRLTIANRTASKAESLAREVGARYPRSRVETAPLSESVANADLVVNSTSMGMAGGEAQEQTPLTAAQIPSGALAYDMVYTPTETPFLREAHKAGAATLGGLWMLIYQGAAALELWTGAEPPVDLMYRAAQRALK